MHLGFDHRDGFISGGFEPENPLNTPISQTKVI